MMMIALKLDRCTIARPNVHRSNDILQWLQMEHWLKLFIQSLPIALKKKYSMSKKFSIFDLSNSLTQSIKKNRRCPCSI